MKLSVTTTSRTSRRSRRLATASAQRFLEGFEALYPLRHGHMMGATTGGSERERVRQVTAAFLQRGRHLRRARYTTIAT